jgi:hypothetical protein
MTLSSILLLWEAFSLIFVSLSLPQPYISMHTEHVPVTSGCRVRYTGCFHHPLWLVGLMVVGLMVVGLLMVIVGLLMVVEGC